MRLYSKFWLKRFSIYLYKEQLDKILSNLIGAEYDFQQGNVVDEVQEVTSEESLTDWRLLKGDFCIYTGKEIMLK